jgi:hypothetical protein
VSVYRRLRILCEEGRVLGAEKIGKTWVMPSPVKITGAASGPAATFHTVPVKRRRKPA